MQDPESHPSVEKRMFGKLSDCSFYLIHPFPEFQIPYLDFFLLMKKAGLKGNGRRSVRVQTHRLYQIAGHLNKAPTEIRSLSLLIGSGGDRRHEHRLFQFQMQHQPSLGRHCL